MGHGHRPGPAGSVCACSALATSDRMRVALIDREKFPRDKSCGGLVLSGAVSELRELGLGAVFDGRPLIADIQAAFPGSRFAFLEKIVDSNNAAACYIVERMVFDHHLFRSAKERGARDYTGYKFTGAEFDDSAGLWTLELQPGRGAVVEIRCRVLVGADGAGSQVRRLAGHRLNGEGHTVVALRAYAQAEGQPEETLRIDWLESLLAGFGWVFPLANGKVNIGVGTTRREFKRTGASLESHLDEYVRYLSSQGVAIRNLGDIKAYPLPLASQTPPLVPKRQMALVGDAASMIDPSTGEGIPHGICAGRVLGRTISGWVNLGGGDPQAGLERYAKAYAGQFGKVAKGSQSLRELLEFPKYFG
ncbi:MAG: geranylgeranyl reductase family protein [Chloroflexi bacterium]|nr:geranylgeranyl reductase family protein [Chloroflexota bacterium]